MNKAFFLFFVLFILASCQSNKAPDTDEIYSFLELCYEDEFENYDIKVTTLLNQFEIQLLNEGHLSDTTGAAYKKLFNRLDTSNYFTPPLHTQDFNKVLLYKNPTNVLNCAVNVYSLDSTTIANTHFAKIEQEIHQKVTNEKEVSIHYFFHIYKSKLSNEEMRKPYIKQNILLLLYRWYYISQEKNLEEKSIN